MTFMKKKQDTNLMNEHYSKTKKYYNKIAIEKYGFYDAKFKDELRHTSYTLNIRNKIFEIFDTLKTKNNIDVGCGNGDFIIKLAKIYLNLNFVGIDFSEEAIKIAESNSKKLKNVRFCVGNMLSLKFKDKSFDTVFCINTLHHIKAEDQIFVLRELGRVSKKNVILEIKNWSNPYYRYVRTCFGKHRPRVENLIDVYPTTVSAVREYLSEVGFRLVCIKPLWRFYYLSPMVVLQFVKVGF